MTVNEVKLKTIKSMIEYLIGAGKQKNYKLKDFDFFFNDILKLIDK